MNFLRRLWNGAVHGHQHKSSLVEPVGMAEWFTEPYLVDPPAHRGETDAVEVWLGWSEASWNRLDGPWKAWSSGQLAACIIRHLRGDHRRRNLVCPLCKEVADADPPGR